MEDDHSNQALSDKDDQGDENGDGYNGTADQGPDSDHMIRFRNYTPQTKFLHGMYTVEKSESGSISHHIQDKLELLKDSNDNTDESDINKYRIDMKLLEAKKIDWDLKHRIEKKMERLERETRKNIDKYIKNQRSKHR